MDGLTQDQQRRLDALIDHLSRFPTQELISVSADLRCPRPIDAAGEGRMRQAMAGSWAFGKITYYVHSLRMMNQERQRLGQEITQLLDRAEDLERTDPVAGVEPRTLATGLSGIQEVTYHFFAICMRRIERLWPLVARATGHHLSTADQALLDSYRPLRHYFEHLEDRAPGRPEQAAVVTEHRDASQWRISIGLPKDDQGRIVINGQPIDVTTRGFDAIEALIVRNYNRTREGCLAQIRQHFIVNPDEIPSPEDIQLPSLITIERATDPQQ